jgi:hypothetical protein
VLRERYIERTEQDGEIYADKRGADTWRIERERKCAGENWRLSWK